MALQWGAVPGTTLSGVAVLSSEGPGLLAGHLTASRV